MKTPNGSVSVEPIHSSGPAAERSPEILTREALGFLSELHQRFEPERRALLTRRAERQAAIDAGDFPGFLPETKDVREGDWTVPPAPADLLDRRVEITGPVERKMMINALNSGASAFMADFEDSNSPTWANTVAGQANIADAVERTISLATSDREYRLNERIATLLVRPRGWHLVERHATAGNDPMSASLFDAGLFLFHNARRLAARGSGPYLYLPKLESHLEARLWHEVFAFCEDALSLPRGTVRATVLIETILAAFEMDEILFELGEHANGLNAGRWDYIFSIIKKFREFPDFMLPDRAQVTMTVPFMRAYSTLLVRTCHARGAHAIGGMAAFIPNRRDFAVTQIALAKVREDKVREANDGFDGTWVAHPDLVPVAREVFDGVLGDRPNQLDRARGDVEVEAADLLDVRIPGGEVTEAGLRGNVSVGVRYLASWLSGTGAAAIDNLMEDAATAEISRSQVWQWIRHSAQLDDGRQVTGELAGEVLSNEMTQLHRMLGADFAAGRFAEAADLFEQVALSERFVEFLTVPAYDHID